MLRFRLNRAHHHARSPRSIHPLVIVGICLGVTVILTLIVGNLLNLRLDDDTYQKLTDGTTEESAPAPEASARSVPLVRAYAFELGAPVSSLTSSPEIPAPTALSVSLNTPDGKLLYSSPVASFQSADSIANVDLVESMTELRAAVPYISGVFYPQALSVSPELIYAATAEEAALLREFASTGASEILLVGLPLDSANRSTSLFYVEQIRSALPTSVSLGISVPYQYATENPELLPALRNSVDFLAIDVCEETAESVLLNANYYLVQHEMRLLLSSVQTDYIGIVDATLSDFQILKAPPVQSPTEP